jgi:hypothetical protein
MLEITSIDLDRRLHTFCANVRANYGWYLNATRGSESNLAIQRKIITGSKAYSTLRNDLKKGCVLPPIVLAIQLNNLAERFRQTNESLQPEELNFYEEALAREIEVAPSDSIYIIDGLQRTNALRQVALELDAEDLQQFEQTPLRLEVWLNIHFGALAYRMLLLNAGQRPMSIKHQVEILSHNIKSELQEILGIEIIDAGRRRVRPGQFQLSKLSLCFQAWLQGAPNVDVRNIVVEQMLADTALETLGSTLRPSLPSSDEDAFRNFVEWLVRVDTYVGSRDLEFFGNETVLQGLAAAVGSVQRAQEGPERLTAALNKLENDETKFFFLEEDFIGIETYNLIRKGIDPSRKNVGEATRNLVFYAFIEYFYSSGNKPMEECWHLAGAR